MLKNESPVSVIFGLVGLVALPFAAHEASKGAKWVWQNRGNLLPKLREAAGLEGQTDEPTEDDHE